MSAATHLITALKSALASPRARQALLAASGGALAFVIFGDTPVSERSSNSAATDWQASARLSDDLSDASARLAETPVWVSQPVPVPEVPVEAARPRLIGLVPNGQGSRRALFVTDAGKRLQGEVGDTVPGLGRLLRIDATRVRWRNDDGIELEAVLFSDGASQPVAPVEPGLES